MLNELLLLSGNDIPFPAAQLVIHQPTISEIAYIGEEKFYTGCELLRFSKDNLTDEDKIHLINQTNFEILMSILNEKNPVTMQHKVCVIGSCPMCDKELAWVTKEYYKHQELCLRN